MSWPDQIHQLERAHPERARFPHDGVDGRRQGCALGKKPQRLAIERSRATIDDKSGGRRRVDRRLAPRRRGGKDRFSDRCIGRGPLTTSTNGINGTGLKKCMPATRPGCLSPLPSAAIDSDDVFDARMQPGEITCSRCANNSRLAFKSSTTASTISDATQVSEASPPW
jgi:hypothetical protein